MIVRQISPINEVFEPGEPIAFFGPHGERETVYHDPCLVVPATNPIVADASGRVGRVYTDRDDIQWLPING